MNFKQAATIIKKAQMGMTSSEMLGRGLAGAIGGGLIGRTITPRIMGYKDDPSAVNMSTLLDASIGGFAGAGLPRMSAWMKDPSMAVKLLGAVGAAELMPVGANMLHSSTHAANQLTEAAKNLKIPPSMSEQVHSALKTPEARGAGAGAATAGIAAILSGLMRPRGDTEIESGRGGMVGRDFLKYVVPAMLAGGVAGNVLKREGTGPKTAL